MTSLVTGPTGGPESERGRSEVNEAVTPEPDRLAGLRERGGTGPLAGVLVADFSRVLAGPYATMLLADMGATVIKVEGPVGDETRSWRPPEHEGVSTYYMSINRNKLDVVLDFADPEDLAMARELARRADVVVENFKVGGLAKFGLDYDSVVQDNPNVVYASLTGFGPSFKRPGYDLLIQGLSGYMSLNGEPDGEPTKSGFAVFDVITGLHTALGIVTALRHRDLTGQGQHVETNLLSSALSGMANQTGAYAAAGVVPTRMGNEHPSLYPYAPFPTGAGELILAVGNDRQFAALCSVLGCEELLDDERFVHNPGRTANRAKLRPVLVAALAARSAGDWYEPLSAAGVPCAPINDVAGGVDYAASIGLEPLVDIDGMRSIANPIRLSETPASYDSAPPALDADGDAIRSWLRG
nr:MULTISPECIES: CoA transferase [unclassified Brevibacterium]